MDAEDKKAAAKHATRATTQAKNAAKNLGKGAKIVVEETAEDVNDALESAADEVTQTAKRLTPQGAAVITTNMGQGILAVAAAAIAVGFATKKFQQAFKKPTP